MRSKASITKCFSDFIELQMCIITIFPKYSNIKKTFLLCTAYKIERMNSDIQVAPKSNPLYRIIIKSY